ncbi:MAG: hypothetical protein OIF47_14210 [Marinibacterium sp.]|nr:hypothetical protein [Marinibacterium sp.]
MTGTAADLTVPERETGRVRLFAVNLSDADIAPMIADPDPAHPDPVPHPTAPAAARLLGTDGLDPSGIELFPVKDLDGLGLVDYLADGHGIPRDQLRPDRARLMALEGHVLLMLSAASRDQAMTLAPGADLTLIGTYGRPRTDWTAAPLDSAAAAPFSGARVPPRVARAEATRRGGILVGVVMALIALALIWMVM